MDRSSLETRITASFIDRTQSNSDISDEFPEILREELDDSSFGTDETVVNAVIASHEE